jgi:hypothetical protein
MIWDGRAALTAARIGRVRAINFFNPDRQIERVGDNGLAWRALTTGNFGGFDCWLEQPERGALELCAGPVEVSLPLAGIGLEDKVFEAGGLDCRVRVFRLPAANAARSLRLVRTVEPRPAGDSALYVRLTQEDGHVAWSSPIYIHR